jgi:nucleotide-binding universal stress UspA family protein
LAAAQEARRVLGFHQASSKTVPMYKRILVATDLSECADAALSAAADLARRQGAEIHVCTALGSPRERLLLGSLALQEENLEAAAQEAKQRLRQKIVGNGLSDVQIRVHVLRHLPGEEIPRAAWRLGCDLIVICSRGDSGPRQFALGAVAERILANSRVPVLVVPPSTRAAPARAST